MWKVAIVGAGYWARNHLLAWRANPKVAVTALCDVDATRLAGRGEEFGIAPEARFGDLDAMLGRVEVDIVDIVTPPKTHLPLVSAAARAGKHVMCIKPFAESIAEAREMAEVVERYGVKAMVSENWRWFQPIRRLKRVLDEGLVGRPYYAKYSSLEYATPLMTDEAKMEQPFLRTMPRLLFYEMGVHWFDVWRFLFGEPERLYAEMRHISGEVAGEDLGVVSISHGDLVGILEMSWVSRCSLLEEKQHHEQMIIEGDRATVTMDAEDQIRLVASDGSASVVDEKARFDTIASIEQLQSHFIQGLENGTTLETDIADNLKTLELVFAAYESAATHEARRLA